MGRGKFRSTKGLALRLTNPDRARAQEAAAHLIGHHGFLPKCMECGGERAYVDASTVPEDIRTGFEEQIGPGLEYTHCPHCGAYSALTGWQHM